MVKEWGGFVGGSSFKSQWGKTLSTNKNKNKNKNKNG